MGLNILAWVKAKKYTDQKTSQTAGLHREIVQSLPLTGDETVIYMVPITGSGDDNYNEYMWINNAYELIGHTKVDLTDYYNKTQVDTALSSKANAATTLSGYGITDAYTKTEVNTALGGKANSATSLSGYGITDAYTKTEVNNRLAGTLDTSDIYVIDELPFIAQTDGYVTMYLPAGKSGSVGSGNQTLMAATNTTSEGMVLNCYVKKGCIIDSFSGTASAMTSLQWISYGAYIPS